jgi:hypothetical protein
MEAALHSLGVSNAPDIAVQPTVAAPPKQTFRRQAGSIALVKGFGRRNIGFDGRVISDPGPYGSEESEPARAVRCA